MNHRNRRYHRNLRNKILVGAIAAALALGMAGTAPAQSTGSYTLNAAPWSQYLELDNYLHSVNNTQSLAGDVSAGLTGADSIFDTYAGSGAPQTNSANLLSALAVGNNATGSPSAPTANDKAGNSIDLGLLGADGFGNSGLGILSGQLNSDNTVTSSLAGAVIATDLTGYDAGAVTQNGNSASAETVMNDASSVISGSLPATAFAGTTVGSATIAYAIPPPVPTQTNAGDITVGNAQVNATTTGSGATVTSGITVTDTGSVNSTATYSNSDDAISGSYIGNRGANEVTALGADGAPVYNGSVVVSNGQANLGAPATTTVSDSPITTVVAGPLLGSITQSGDSISASTQGNTASNSIGFASGIDIAGTDAAAASTLDLVFGFSTVNASEGGDLVLLNVQGNQLGSSFASTVSGTSAIAVETGAVAAAGASVTLHDDHMTASAGGNAASNGISSDGASFDALVAAGNQQANDASAVTATVTDGRVGAYMDSGVPSVGDISVDASSIGAGAQGNQATTDVSLSGTSFSAGSGVGTGEVTIVGGFLTVDTGNAGVSVGNSQSNFGAGTAIGATVTDGWLGTYYTGPLLGGSSTVSDNAIGASAGGNAGTTSAELSGGTGVFTAALVNGQYNANDITGTLDTPYAGIYVDAGPTIGATLTANGNSFSASAHGNQGTNTLSGDFTNATVGDGADPWAAVSGSIDTIAEDNIVANGALTLTSMQWSDGNAVTAGTTDGQMGILVGAAGGGDLVGSTATVNGNSSSATAVANQVTNTLDPGVGNLTASGGTATQVATLSSVQFADGNDVSAGISLSAAATDPAMIGAVVTGNIIASPVTVSDNGINAFAAADVAANAMAVTGSNYAPATLADATVVNGYQVFAAVNTVSAAYVLQNEQETDLTLPSGSRTASVSNGSVGAAAVGPVIGSALTVGSNQIGADARDNYATNGLSLAGFSTLGTTAALQSEQLSAALGVSATVSDTNVAAGSLVADVFASDVTLSGNALSAKAIGNTSLSTLSVQAGQLTGTSNDLAAYPTLRGAVAGDVGTPGQVLADYGLGSQQFGYSPVTASLTNDQIGGGAGGDFNGGSLTVGDNTQTALAQVDSAANAVALQATSVTASAALYDYQYTNNGADASAAQSSDDTFAAYVGGALGTTTVVPVTVSGNTLLAQAGLTSASNTLSVDATGAIAGTGLTTAGASTDFLTYGYRGAVADFALFNNQVSHGNATASISPGLVGIEVAGGGIGIVGNSSGLTVGDNQLTARASGNDAGNVVALNGASSIDATTALNNQQFNNSATAITATASNARVGIYDDTAADVSAANLTVSGNSLTAGASGNSATNAISVLPVALNAGIDEATLGSADSNTGFVTAGASQSLANEQVNFAAITATASNSTIGVDADGTAASLLTSVANVAGNSATASASGNSASNSIMLASLSSGVASSALASNQINLANVTATASNVQIGVTAGTGSSTPVTVSGNTISATAIGNSAGNHIGIGH